MADDLHARASAAVDVQAGARRIKGQIATNPTFKPREIRSNPPNTPVAQRKYGVNPDTAEEVPIAGEALVGATLKALGEAQPVLTVQEWIERESTRLGGKGKLTAALLGIEYKGVTKNPHYRALLRAIQRSAKATKAGRTEEHKGFTNPAYIRMIADLPAAELGNPYVSPDRRARAALDRPKVRVQLSAMGDWRISEEVDWGAWHGTDLEPAERFRDMWNLPATFLAALLEAIRHPTAGEESPWSHLSMRDMLELDWLYALQLIIELPEE